LSTQVSEDRRLELSPTPPTLEQIVVEVVALDGRTFGEAEVVVDAVVVIVES
jgi:hypothetical protein